MKPPKFKYVMAESVDEALTVLAEHGDDARPLAGGQSLVPLMNMRIARPAVLVDLNRVVGLDVILVDDGALMLGPMVRQSAAERNSLVADHSPLLKQTLRYIGPPAIKNRGTIGGSLAHADPVAELPGAALALGAELIVESKDGRRTVTPEDFYVAELTTAIEPGEMLREVRLPKMDSNAKTSFVESGNRQEGLAIAGVACTLRLNDVGECEAISLAAIGVGPGPTKLVSTEQMLVGERLAQKVIDEAAAAAVNDIDPRDDIHASAHYRRRLTVALVSRAIDRALAA